MLASPKPQFQKKNVVCVAKGFPKLWVWGCTSRSQFVHTTSPWDQHWQLIAKHLCTTVFTCYIIAITINALTACYWLQYIILLGLQKNCMVSSHAIIAWEDYLIKTASQTKVVYKWGSHNALLCWYSPSWRNDPMCQHCIFPMDNSSVPKLNVLLSQHLLYTIYHSLS